MAFFSPTGHILIGKHRGKHASVLPEDYAGWAEENLRGFAAEYEKARLVEIPEAKQGRFPKGRRYVLDWNKKFIPHIKS